MTSYTIHLTLDCVEYDCPMVLAQVKESLDRLLSGEVVEVITEEDPRFELVIKAFVSETKDIYIHSVTEENQTHHFIQKALDEIRKQPEDFPMVISNHELQDSLAKGKTMHILDVREDFEFMLGHLPGAINVPLSNLTVHLNGFDKGETYYIICRTGNRSNYACKYMESLGFRRVYNVLPGMHKWDGILED